MITTRVTGADEARKAARALRRIERTTLEREIRGTVKSTVDELLPATTRASVAAHVPSGFALTAARSIRVITATKLSTSREVRVQVTVWGKAKVQHRDIAAMNMGRLKHPVFGRERRVRVIDAETGIPRMESVKNPWHLQAIRPGMVDKPVAALRPPLVARIDGSLSRIADRFNTGGSP